MTSIQVLLSASQLCSTDCQSKGHGQLLGADSAQKAMGVTGSRDPEGSEEAGSPERTTDKAVRVDILDINPVSVHPPPGCVTWPK